VYLRHTCTYCTEYHGLADRDGPVHVGQGLELSRGVVTLDVVLFDVVQALLLPSEFDDHRVVGDHRLGKPDHVFVVRGGKQQHLRILTQSPGILTGLVSKNGNICASLPKFLEF
jgi:hypothetical protein